VVWLKLDRANRHIGSLDEGIKAFLAEDAAGPLVYEDDQAKQALTDTQIHRVVPMHLSVTAGEVLYQLRSALDHMACILIQKGGGTLSDQSQFPIERFRPTKREDIRRYERKIRGMSPEDAAGVEQYQPYRLGDKRDQHFLVILKTLNNLDKHRGLVLHTVRVRTNVHVTLGPAGAAQGSEHEGHEPTRLTLTAGGLSNEVELVKMERHLTPFVAFSALTGRDDIPVLDTLVSVSFNVRQTIMALGKFL
jgi:hypothetical protein